MIETLMFFALGFLAASLLALVVVPLVHDRAERLTAHRIEASSPLSVAEIRADRDQLRAEFAMSTRRLELSVEQLRATTASQLAELGRRASAISRLKLELDAGAATIAALSSRRPPGLAGDGVALNTERLQETGGTLAGRDAEIARLNADLDERSRIADSQRVEIVALKIEIDALKGQVAELGWRRAAWRQAIKQVIRWRQPGHLSPAVASGGTVAVDQPVIQLPEPDRAQP